MEAGLGQLGFWLFLGLICAASIVSAALKERDKLREKQATLRALLEKDGPSATEVLAYMRERDAAEAAAAARVRARMDETTKRWARRGRVAIGIFAFVFGIWAFGAVRYGVFHGSGSLLIPLALMFGSWVLGLIIVRPIWRSAKQTNDAHPDA